METFVRVVDAGSFKKAAQTLRVLPSTVTKTIKDLETYLGVQLLIRTTRTINVTEAGLRYYDSCKSVIRDVQSAEDAVANNKTQLSGTIRIGTTPSLARRFVIPSLPRFMARHPALNVDFQLTDSVADLIQEGIDCVIRAGEPQLSSLIRRHIAEIPWYICASPDYLEQYGEPLTLVDLGRLLAVGYGGNRNSRSTSWDFRHLDTVKDVSLTNRIVVNDTDAYLSAGIAGLGLIRIASYMAEDHLKDGRLRRVLPDFEVSTEPLSIYYPQSRYLSPGVRAFIDWSVQMLKQEARKW